MATPEESQRTVIHKAKSVPDEQCMYKITLHELFSKTTSAKTLFPKCVCFGSTNMHVHYEKSLS